MKQTIILITTLLLLILPVFVTAQGVIPAQIELTEEDQTFQFKITNRQALEMDVILEIQGDQFIELEQEKLTFKENDKEKLLTGKIKENTYTQTQKAYILAMRQIKTDSQITINSGNAIKVSLLIYSDEANLDATMNMPFANRLGKGPYLVNIQNKGLENVKDAEATVKINNQIIKRTFSINGTEKKELVFELDDELKKGMHPVELIINYDGKTKKIANTVQSGNPKINITKIRIDSLENDILTLNIQLNNDWPEEIKDLSIKAHINEKEYETRTFNANPKTTTNIPLTFRANEEFTALIKINDYDTKEYEFEIKNGKVYINGEEQYTTKKQTQTQTNIIQLILLMIIIFILSTIIIKKNIKRK